MQWPSAGDLVISQKKTYVTGIYYRLKHVDIVYICSTNIF